MSEEVQDKTPEINKDLTDKEEAFCYEYCIDYNATKAAIRAGYSEKSAAVTACRMLTKANIKKKIQGLKDNLAETAGISALRVIKEHEKIAFLNGGKLRDGWYDPTEFDLLTDDEKACIQEVSTRQGMFGASLKVKLYDKQKSLDSISDILGFKAPTKNELTGKDGKPLIPSMDLSKLSDAELLVYHSLLEKANATAD
ncbi:MAG: terminase small subunit [Bacteroidetes bacterium]|nr:terminase small subunit [Bacteroidota bacterium]